MLVSSGLILHFKFKAMKNFKQNTYKAIGLFLAISYPVVSALSVKPELGKLFIEGARITLITIQLHF